jgi:hypothetical protein
MRSSIPKFFTALVVALLAATIVSAQAGSTSVPNWTVPAYQHSSSEGGLTTMTDNSPGVAFVGMQPCRVFDTRDPVGPYGGPRLIANTTRNFDIDSGPCGPIPALVQAYSMNFGAILADGDGFITIWPAGAAQPLSSSMNTIAGKVIANSAIVPAGSGGAISIFPNTGVHLYGDINGYFTQGSNSGTGFQYFAWSSDNTGTFGAAIITNTNTGTGDTWALVARVNSTGAGTAAVRATALAQTGETYAVRGDNNSGGGDSAGVYGTANLDDDPVVPFPILLYSPAGVRGVSGTNGVIGIGESAGVIGALEAEAGGLPVAQGRLGTNFGTDPGGGGPNWAVFGLGDIGASGAKFFLDPHPTDASKVIGYIALEGPEAGTYFRGRGKFERGMAKISIPEDFRLVTDPDGLTVQVTPIGAMATVGVLKIDLNEIVVQSSRNVEFSYLVQGVRATYKDTKPIFEAGVFRPESAQSTMPRWLSEAQKQRLIANGTFREDGRVNMETAQRLGWDRVWEREKLPAVQTPE